MNVAAVERDPKLFTHDLGILSRRIEALIAKGRLQRSEYQEYKALVGQYLAYAEHAIQNSTTAEVQQAYRSQRAQVLASTIAFDRVHGTLLHGTKVRVREWFMTLSPATQKTFMLGAITVSLGVSVGARALVLGLPGAVLMVASAFGAGLGTRHLLNKWAEEGATNKLIRIIVNAREVETAEAELQKTLAEYTEEHRYSGVKKVAAALAKKRSALLGQRLSIIAAGSLTGFLGGRLALAAAEVTPDLIPGARAATLHNPDGSKEALAATTGQTTLYNRLLRYDGWFAVQNDDGTYNVYRYERGQNVRFAVGSVENLSEVRSGPVLELKTKDLAVLNDVDRRTVERFRGPWYFDPFRGNSKTQVMSEDEMRTDGLYTMSKLPWRLTLTPEFWGNLMSRIPFGLRSQEVLYNNFYGPDNFMSVFPVGEKGMSDKGIATLFSVIFGKHVTGVDLPEGTTSSVVMTTSVNDHSEWAWWYWLTDQEVPPPEIVGSEDYLTRDMPGWRRAFFLAHELGHAIHTMTHMDEVLNALPVAEREEIMRELYGLRDYLLQLKADGAKTGYKGWSEDMRQMVQVTARVEDDELFADAFSKLLTNPEVLKEKCPRLYEFLKGLINSDTRLRRVIGVK